MSVTLSFSPFSLTFSSHISSLHLSVPFIIYSFPMYSPFVRVPGDAGADTLRACVRTDARNPSVMIVSWLSLIETIAIDTFRYPLSHYIQTCPDYIKNSALWISNAKYHGSIDCNFVKCIFHYVVQNGYLMAAIVYWKQNKDKEISLCSLAIR